MGLEKGHALLRGNLLSAGSCPVKWAEEVLELDWPICFSSKAWDELFHPRVLVSFSVKWAPEKIKEVPCTRSTVAHA